MKKKPTPVIPIILLVAALGVVMFINFPRELLPQPGQTPPPAAKTEEAPSKESLAQKTAQAVKGTKASQMRGPADEEADTGPALALPKRSPYKPKPNDSSTSTQWYNDATPTDLPKTK